MRRCRWGHTFVRAPLLKHRDKDSGSSLRKKQGRGKVVCVSKKELIINLRDFKREIEWRERVKLQDDTSDKATRKAKGGQAHCPLQERHSSSGRHRKTKRPVSSVAAMLFRDSFERSRWGIKLYIASTLPTITIRRNNILTNAIIRVTVVTLEQPNVVTQSLSPCLVNDFTWMNAVSE